MCDPLIDLEELLDCPDCPNQGWYAVGSYNNPPEQEQCEFCYSEPRSKFNAMLTVQSSIENTTNFYDKYQTSQDVRDKFSISEHCSLVGKVVLTINKNIKYSNEKWYLSGILKLTDIIKDIANNSETLDKESLSAIVPMYYIVENLFFTYGSYIPGIKNNTPQLKSIEDSLDKITDFIYGSNKEHIMILAKNFNLVNDPNYWLASVNNPKKNYIADVSLPTL